MSYKGVNFENNGRSVNLAKDIDGQEAIGVVTDLTEHSNGQSGLSVNDAINKATAEWARKSEKQTKRIGRKTGKIAVKEIKRIPKRIERIVEAVVTDGLSAILIPLAVILLVLLLAVGTSVLILLPDRKADETTEYTEEQLINGQLLARVALAEVGNEGGEPYWQWFGFLHHVEWCACFVSWCADQCGLINSDALPKFAGCSTGINWFESHKQWVEQTTTPIAGMIIFFDWADENGAHDGIADHVGIIWKVENGSVFVIEGNKDDAVTVVQYAVTNESIFGYGLL